MPIMISSVAGGTGYASPMVGPVDQVLHKKLDISTLTTAEVDANGELKPGLPLKEAAGLLVLIGAAAGVPFMVFESVKLPLATVPPTDATLATETGDCLVAVCVAGVANLDICEDNLGRALTANEKTSFVTAGSLLALTTT